MSKARGLADLGNAYSDGALSNRNLIINGGLTIWQRGASHAAGSGINYTADRFWRYNPSASGTIERSTDAPDDFEYSLFFNVTGGGNNLGTGVELPRQGFFPQKMYTLSMYLKGDFSGTSIYINYRNSAGSGTDNVDITTFNSFGSYSDWTRVTVPVDTTGITPNANNLFMNMEFGGFPDGGKITGVQLEVGDTATPFEHRRYSDELQSCMRYYQFMGGTAYAPLGVGKHYAAGQSTFGTVPFLSEMRSPPSVVIRGTIMATDRVSYDDNITALTGASISTSSLYAAFNTGTTRTDRTFHFIAPASGSTGGLEFDAEL